MATVISGTVINGVTLSAAYGHTNPVTVTGLIIDAGNDQVALLGQPTNPWTITNQGTIAATGTHSHGIYIPAGGSVNNSGLIDATSIGVYYATNLTNSGTIVGDAFGVRGGGAGGALTNTGLILGGSGSSNSNTRVDNAGTIIGTTGYGVRLLGVSPALVTNTGTIAGLSGSAITFDTFNPNGTVVNGTSLSTGGLIDGSVQGIFFQATGTVINFGTIGNSAGYGSAIFIGGSGVVLNGNATATGRLIDGGFYGVRIAGGGTVSNFGTISAENAVGVTGGNVFNGSSSTPGALIHGTNDGVAGATNITNYGTIIGEVSFAIDGGAGGTIINPEVGLIAGGNGGIRTGATLVSNAGTIVGTTGYGLRVFATDGLVLNTALISGNPGTGVSFDADGILVNGTSLSTAGLVSGGNQGVLIGGAGTVINFGSISGQLGYGTGSSSAAAALS